MDWLKIVKFAQAQGYTGDRGWVVELQARPATVAEMAALGATKEGRET